jgi:hypothetical protein
MVPTPWDAITCLLGNRNRHADPVVSKPANRPTVTRPVAHTPQTRWDPGPRDCPEEPAGDRVGDRLPDLRAGGDRERPAARIDRRAERQHAK